MEVFKLFGTISLNKADALKDLREVEKEAEKSASKFDQHFGKIGKSAEKWLKRGAVLAVAGLTAAMAAGVKAAKDYETSMVELAKVTDPDTAGSVGAAVREMAKDMPLAHEALMGIAADAGRLGVEGVDNILNFTKTVAQISVATDIMAEDAGTNFAKLLKLLGEDIDVVDELGSAINELSNNMATSSSEIVDGMLRSSAALKGLNLGTDEVVALNAAMNEVSESSMRAGTALRTVAEKLKNPEKMKELAEALGITVDEFRAMREENPMELFKQLSLAMNEGGEKAEELTGILGESASRLQALGTNWQGVEEAVRMANAEFQTATSLQKEYNTATDTFGSRVETLRNNFHDVAIDVGNALIPALDSFVSWMQSNTPEIEELMVGIAGGIASTLGWILEHKEGIGAALAVIGTGIAALGLASLLANLNPISLAIAAISAAIAALLVYWDDVVRFFKDIGSAISGWASGAWSAVKGFFGFGEDAASEIALGIKSGKAEVQAAVRELMTPEEAKEWGKSVARGFSFGMDKELDNGGFSIAGESSTPSPLGSFTDTGSTIPTFAPPDPNGTVSAWQSMWDRIKDTFSEFKDETKAAWDETRTIIGDAVGSIFHDTVSTWWAQASQHREAMDTIRDDTKASLLEEEKLRDEALKSINENLANELITQEAYNVEKQNILDRYESARERILDQEKDMLNDEEEAYKKQKQSLWEILKESVRNVLTALKEELLLKSAAALAEAIAMTLGLNPMAVPKYAEAGAYAAGAGGLAIAGFEKGALFNRPTLLPPHVVAESGVSEAYLPLSEGVFSKIGQGIVNALAPQPTPALAGGVQIDMRGMYDGAQISVRSDNDIKELARQNYELFKSTLNGRGL